MRAALLIMALLLSAACKDEPDFDTRYDKAAKEIEVRVEAMDDEIAESEKAATAAPDSAATVPAPDASPSSGE